MSISNNSQHTIHY